MVLTPKGSVTGGLLCIFQTLNTLGWLRQLFLCPLGLNLNLTKLCPVLVSRLKLHQAEVMAVLCTLLASITTTRVYSPTFPTRLCALMSWLCGIQAPPHSSFQLHSATKKSPEMRAQEERGGNNSSAAPFLFQGWAVILVASCPSIIHLLPGGAQAPAFSSQSSTYSGPSFLLQGWAGGGNNLNRCSTSLRVSRSSLIGSWNPTQPSIHSLWNFLPQPIWVYFILCQDTDWCGRQGPCSMSCIKVFNMIRTTQNFELAPWTRHLWQFPEKPSCSVRTEGTFTEDPMPIGLLVVDRDIHNRITLACFRMNLSRKQKRLSYLMGWPMFREMRGGVG